MKTHEGFDEEDACFKLLNELGLRGAVNMLAKVVRQCAEDGLSVYYDNDNTNENLVEPDSLLIAANNLEADLY